MRLDEVNDPVMKLRLELAKVKLAQEERDKIIDELVREVTGLKQTMTKLIRKLGPQ